jgi:hypothetical protein
MQGYVRSDDLADLGLDPAPIRAMWDEFTRGRHHRPDLIWQVFVLVAWAREFKVQSSKFKSWTTEKRSMHSGA